MIFIILIEDLWKKHFCEIILKSVHWSRRRCHLKVLPFLALAPFCSVEQTDFSNFGRGSLKEHFCEIILKSCHYSRRRCRLRKLLTEGRTNIKQNSSP